MKRITLFMLVSSIYACGEITGPKTCRVQTPGSGTCAVVVKQGRLP